MAVHLSPAEVVTDVLDRGIEDDTPIKGGRVLERSGWEERLPMEDVVGRKARNCHRHQFAR